MSSTVITLILIGIIGLIVLFAIVGIYNKLVTLKNRFENAFSQIEVQLQRRYDLIPNLIETVKGYMAHEKETLEAVIQARNQAQSSLQAASQNPVMPAIAGLAGAEDYLAELRPYLRPFGKLSGSQSQSKHGQSAGRIEQY